ncbi:hypothetical protein NUW58_g4050 [Xylaria curta]|uniref:Uncharacterized protein n=1 Tax=Xylaria curta TaxID=42375 RepID=A0ACC1P9G5_9PEZI|nr:hypothetical protein NUW58_g4050 [Xylaria curta]
MTAKAPEPKLRGQRPWQDKRDEDFRFQFQDDMVAHTAQSATSNEASAKEAEANRLIAYMREEDEATFKERSLHPGQHFLDVREVLEDARLFHVARMMPKGAHLHIHFNSTLLPDVLLGYAKEMPNMYIWSDHQLLEDSDFRDCKLEFSLRNLEQVRKDMHKKAAESDDYYLQAMLDDAKGLSDETAKIHAYDALGPNIFSSSYKHGPKDKKQEVEEMRYQYFRERWDEEARGNCDEWLIQKLTFSKEEVRSFYDEPNHVDIEPKPVVVNPVPSNTENPTSNGRIPQAFNEQEWIPETAKKISSSEFKHVRDSARKAWTAFNGRTKMMKGLFNYESAFRQYTRKCLEEFVRDNVQYAEIRPNFMQTNQILNDTAETKIDNFGTMELIIGEYTKFMKEIGDMRQDGTIIDDEQHRPALSGMKVIYCTPRSFSRDAVKKALDECIEMKKRWPDYIAGFDLVGEEAFRELHPLKYFEDEFQYFKQRCKEEGFDIPFLFHCGETPDDLEGNLETALELDAKRIGHGYALPQKVEVLRAMRSKNICVETCPISNMVLGLAERMDQHSVYRLLEEKMHCAVSSDNGTLFKSTLSHDFYEVMAGHQKINLYGWKQLARWSIEHSVLSEEERRRMLTEWERRWQDFINALIEASGSMSPVGSISELRKARDIVEATRLAKLDKANGSTSTILSDS